MRETVDYAFIFSYYINTRLGLSAERVSERRSLGNRICTIQRCVRAATKTTPSREAAVEQVGWPFVLMITLICLKESRALGERGRTRKKFISRTRRRNATRAKERINTTDDDGDDTGLNGKTP